MPVLSLTSVHKRFGALEALRGVTLSVEAGERLALVGENGAGKSTLMKIAAGLMAADAGMIAPSRAGIAMVQQHFSLAPALTAAENLALHSPLLPPLYPRPRIGEVARAMVASSGIAFEPLHRRTADLSVGEMSKLELIRALASKPRVLILDEPTSVLTPREVEELLASLRSRAAEGTAVILISHKLPEVFAFAERIAVMRAGELVSDTPVAATDAASVARAMVGRDPAEGTGRSPRRRGEPRLRLTGVTSDPSIHAVPLRDVSLELSAGTITSVVGVAGNGQNALADVLRGLAPAGAGTIELLGRPVGPAALLEAREVAHIPSDRTRQGIVASLTVAENLALGQAFRGRRRGMRDAEATIHRFGIRGRARDAAGSLSGGNQQKVILARELSHGPLVVVASEPTRGLDVRSTAFVHDELRAAADRGAAILLITSDLDEAAALADTLHVMNRGSLSEPLDPKAGAEEIGLRMGGSR